MLKDEATSAIVAAVVATIIGSLFKMWSDHKIEKLRGEVEKEQIRFRRVDKKQAEVLMELYRCIDRVYSATLFLIQDIGKETSPAVKSLEVKKGDFHAVIKEFGNAMRPAQLYLPPQLYQETKDCFRAISKTGTVFLKQQQAEEYGREVGDYHANAEESLQAAKTLLESLIAKYQEKLGITD